MLSTFKKFAMRLGYQIRGNHHFYIFKNDEPRIVEILGLQGKTTLLKKMKKYKMKKVKPNIFLEKDRKYFTKIDALIINQILSDIQHDDEDELIKNN